MTSMEMSLDDIIATRPKTARRPSQRGTGTGKGRAQILGTGAGANPVTKARAKAQIMASPAVSAQTTEKIIVSNLPMDVNEAQVKELFQSTVGPLKQVNLHYDAAGRSKGVATVIFNKKGDGNRAFSQYNNRLIDGKRPMKIEIVMDPGKAPVATLASRVAPAPNAARTGSARGRPGRRGRGGGGGGARPPKAERKPVTAADLDAEMEDYTTSNAPAAAATM